MKNILIKPMLIFSTMVGLSLYTITGSAYAANTEYETRCAELTNQTWEKAPSPLAIICPLVRYLNVILFASAGVFVIMVFASAIKYALSQGDPKALQGAKGTVTWALIGFIVVIGVFTILIILKNVLGLKDSPILNPVGVLNNNLMDLFNKFGINNY